MIGFTFLIYQLKYEKIITIDIPKTRTLTDLGYYVIFCLSLIEFLRHIVKKIDLLFKDCYEYSNEYHLISKMLRSSMSKSLVDTANRHILLRWVGVPFFVTGLLLLFSAFHQALYGGNWFYILIGLACSLMGLTCFGLNHDTAISLAIESRKQNEDIIFSEQLERELQIELERDKAGALGLQGNPKLALFLPILVLGVQLFEAYLLFWK